MLHKSGKDKMKTTVVKQRSSWGRTKVTGQMLYLEASLGRPSCRFLKGWMEFAGFSVGLDVEQQQQQQQQQQQPPP